MTATDRYPIKDFYARLRGLFARRDCPDDRLAQATAVIPVMSNPFKGGYYITQQFRSGHPAIDYGMPVGTGLYAAHAGQVVKAGQDWTGYGWVICIKDDSRGLYTVYGHLNYAAGVVVRVGQWVAEREHIGYSGNTGRSTGPHLHIELRIPPYGYPSTCVDPLKYMQVWSGTTPPPTPPPPTPTPTGKMRTVRNSPIIKKKTGKKVGLYAAGALLTVGDPVDDWTYVPAQLGQPAGFVKTANLTKA